MKRIARKAVLVERDDLTGYNLMLELPGSNKTVTRQLTYDQADRLMERWVGAIVQELGGL